MGSNTISSDSTDAAIEDALRSLRRLVRTLRSSATGVERTTGLSTAQIFVLQLLDDAHADSMNALAERTMTDQSSVSVVVARLEARGLVRRHPSPLDGRRTAVSITELGRQALGGAPPTVQARLTNALRQLSPDDLRDFGRGLTQVVTLVGAADEPATLLFEDDATGAH